MKFIWVRPILFIVFWILSYDLSMGQDNRVQEYDNIVITPDRVPQVFDLRKKSGVITVKTQSGGGCWASASNGTVETWWKSSGLGSLMISDLNLQLTHGFENSRNTYGNHFMATAYYSRMSGPVPNDPLYDSVVYIRASVPYYNTDARYLPNSPNLIKQTIMDFGPVYSMLYFNKKKVDTITFVLYHENRSINHAVMLIGWNDTLTTNNGKGVWIAQNSLGTKFGDSGFFYIPFQDENILKHNAVWTGWKTGTPNLKLHYHDTLGSFNSYGFDDTVCYGLVRYTADSDCKLVQVASFINAPGTRLSAEVYANFDESSKTLSGKISESVMKDCTFAGYYTIDLINPVEIEVGTTFYVMMRYSNPNEKLLIPIEEYIKDYCDPQLSSGKCWINPDYHKWPLTWYPCGMDSPYPVLDFDLCIRALTISME